jgi:hypothetical protein
MRPLNLLVLAPFALGLSAGPAAAQGVPTHPFASNLPSYPRPRVEADRPMPPHEMSRRRTAACVGEASARGFEGRRQRAFVRACLSG